MSSSISDYLSHLQDIPQMSKANEQFIKFIRNKNLILSM